MATTPPSFRRRPDSDEIVLTDRELVSCYIRYSENLEDVSYSPEKASIEPASSSPASAASNHDGDTSHISTVSNSTTQTTPLRNDLLAMARRRPPSTPFEELTAVLIDAELPASVKDQYREQGRNIIRMAGRLFPGEQLVSQWENIQRTIDLIATTSDWFVTALHDAEVHVQNIAYIQTLGPFTVSPGPDELWPVYKQMAELLLAHTQSPSRDLVDVIEAMANVYDAYVYQPLLSSSDMAKPDSGIEPHLHSLYDAIMSLLMKHQEWCRSTKQLIKNHMRPALESISSNEVTMQKKIDDEAARKGAAEILENTINPGCLPVSAEVLRVLREKRSTQLLQIRAKRKFTRVYTV